MTRSAAIAFAVVIICLVWMGKRTDSWSDAYSFAGKKTDYYSLLVHGMLEGHLYMKAAVNPDLLSSDPVVRRAAPFMQDANLYHGRYYLYYGVVPAVCLALPYAFITGSDLSPNVITVLYTAIGFIFSVMLYIEAKQLCSMGRGFSQDWISIAVLGFCTVTPTLIRNSAHYEIPIAAGYAMSSMFIFCIWRALRREGQQWKWIAAASLAGGLAVGCRPNLILYLPALAAVAAFIVFREYKRRDEGIYYWIRILTATVAPAAVIGTLLAAYNFGRFGSPFEFGFKYGMNAFFSTGKPLFSWAFIWPNLSWYYFTFPTITTFFPFVFPIYTHGVPAAYYSDEAVHGQFFFTVLAIVGGFALIRAMTSGKRLPTDLLVVLFVLAWMFISSLTFMISLGIRADRYITDFQAPLALMATLVGIFAIDGASFGWTENAIWRAAFRSAAIFAAIFNFLIPLDELEYTRPSAFLALAKPFASISNWFYRKGFIAYGPVTFDVTFRPVSGAARSEAIVVTGHPLSTDLLSCVQHSDKSIRLVMLHRGFGEIASENIKIDYGRSYHFEVDMGSLYPPKYDPFYDGMERLDVERLKTMERVRMDNRDVILGKSKFYDAPPGWIFFGIDPSDPDTKFSGEIANIKRLPPRRPVDFEAFSEQGIWRLVLDIPAGVRSIGLPLLGSGVSGNGNLLFLTVKSRDSVVLGVDDWSYGCDFSATIRAAEGERHIFEVFVGSQVLRHGIPSDWQIGADRLAAASNVMRVWMDGLPIWTEVLAHHQETYDIVGIGENRQGFNSATTYYTGALQNMTFHQNEARAFIMKNLELGSH